MGIPAMAKPQAAQGKVQVGESERKADLSGDSLLSEQAERLGGGRGCLPVCGRLDAVFLDRA